AEANFQQHLRSRFYQTQTVSGDQRTRSVIRGFIFATNSDRHTTQRARNLARNCCRAAVSFNRKYNFFQVRRAASAERLHGMKRARGSAAASKCSENHT